MLTALAAPAVPIIDASTGQKPSIEGPGQIDRPTHLP
jgi:hypothetical protein